MKKTILILILICLGIIAFAQKGIGYKVPSNGQIDATKGKYNESGAVHDFPYTLFVKTKAKNYNVISDINTIREYVQKRNKNFKNYYKTVFENALTPFDSGDTNDIGGHIKYKTWGWDSDKQDSAKITINRKGYRSPSAVKCKNAAFVYLMAFNKYGDTSVFRSSDSHSNFKTQAINRLRYMNIKTGSSQNYLQWRTKELILYLQAYDMLKTAEMLGNKGYTQYSFSSTEKVQLDSIKYNLQHFTRNIYRSANALFNAFDERNNHSIMAAGAVGLAAIVLNDCGHKGIKYNWHPDNWIYKAHKVIRKTLWDCSDPLSERGKIAGYAEGPHYFRYCFENATPFFRAMLNYVPKKEITNEKVKKNKDIKYMTNYLYDDDIMNLFEWYFKIVQPNGDVPSYDDTRFVTHYGIFNVITGITSNNQFNYHNPTSYGSGVHLEADYLAYGSKQLTTISEEASYALYHSGDLILKSDYSKKDYESHYVRLSGERGTSVNGGQHENQDLSSFIIVAGKEILAMDPGYLSMDAPDPRGDAWRTQHARDHNLILVDRWILQDAGPKDKTEGEVFFKMNLPSLKSGEVTSNYRNTAFNRKIEMFDDNNSVYYVLTDEVNRDGTNSKEYIWCLNGNGNVLEKDKNDSATCIAVNSSKSKIIWRHPCLLGENIPDTTKNEPETWSLQAFVSVKGGAKNYELITRNWDSSGRQTIHGNSNSYVTNGYGKNTHNINFSHGYHTRLEVTKTTTETVFLTVLWPYKCNEPPPTMTKTETNDYACITINNFNGNDVFHHAKLSNATVNHTNPYNFANCNAVLTYNAENAMLKLSRNNSVNFGNCTANTRFRIASIDNGTILTYDDTTYISAAGNVKTAYEIIGKYKYKGFIENNSGGNVDVTFFLPDCEPQYDMMATDLMETPLTYSYNNGELKITVTFPVGVSKFYLTLTDPCLASCYFPTTQETIDTLFVFDPDPSVKGKKETLGYDLDIVQPNGHLKIVNGNKMFICSDYVLANYDSITMLGLYTEGDENLPLYTQYGEDGVAVVDTGKKQVDSRKESLKSMIIIKEDAGLVLMSESYTHIGANSTILVKNGGTLLIKENAHVEIGSADYPGYGEIIAEDGAFVCIEPNADIHFYSNPDDSTDKNIFYVFNPAGDTIFMIGGGIKTTGSNAATNQAGCNGKFLPDSIFGGSQCIGFCELKNINQPYGINNRDFGWANINYPKAVAQMVDTFCYGSNVTVDAIKTLNETKWHFKVCECDYPTGNCISPFTTIPVKGYDTVRISDYNLSDEYTFNEGMHYKARFVVKNDCHETDIAEKIIYISPLPEVTFVIPADACPGVGTLLATNGQNSINELSYKWTISMLGQDNFHPDDEDAYYHEKTYSNNGEVQDSFDFPGFRLLGNRKYEVELKVTGFCGVSTKTDTVEVPYAVYIDPDEANIYFDGYGDTSVQLNGSIYGFSTFQWNPTSYLSNSSLLDPVASPPGSISYILSASEAGCSDADTVNISVNFYANAGTDKIICKSDSIELGFSGKTIPANMYIDWKPTTNMDDSTIVNPTVFPNVTTQYTMNIRLNSDNSLVESDEVTVYVDSAVSPSYLVDLVMFYDDSATFYFENDCDPYLPTTTYTWTFSDGSDTSHLVNVYHTFYRQAVDTYFVVCLTSSTACSDSTYCDTIFYLADSNEWEFWIAQVSSVIETIKPESSYLIGNIPNPFKDQTTIKYHLAENTGNAEIVIYNMFGKHVKTIKLRPNSDTYNLDWSAYAKGIYGYSLLIDGILKDSKKMIKL